jgi:ribonuclease-3
VSRSPSTPRIVRPPEQLQQRLGHTFNQPLVLAQALTHRSHGSAHNERLEFLGDSVLNCAVADLLYAKFGKLNEGDLSRVRANLVKQQALFEIAQTLELSQYLHLGEGELKSGGLRRPSILADALEAIIGAVFIDAGFDAARKMIGRLYTPILAHIDPQTLGKDDKTLLQEYLQANKLALPQYTVIATHGAAHSQQFEVECSVPELDIKVLGNGASRRAAEQVAANLALALVRQTTPRVAKRTRASRPVKKKTETDPQLLLKLKS